jgi:hypothetical protein
MNIKLHTFHKTERHITPDGRVAFRRVHESTAFGSGLRKRTKFADARNLGDILDVLESHVELMKSKMAAMEESKDVIEETLETFTTFESSVSELKRLGVSGIKKALDLKNSPEVKAASNVEASLKSVLSTVFTEFASTSDIKHMMTVVNNKYGARGAKVVTAVNGGVITATKVDYQQIKNGIEKGDFTEDDVLTYVTDTSVFKGVKNKAIVTQFGPILDRMNTMVEAAESVEAAVIDPAEFKELRDLVSKLVAEAATPTETIKTAITALNKETIKTIPTESYKVYEGILDKIKSIVASIKNKLVSAWTSFTTMFFSVEDKAMESADAFSDVEQLLASVGVVSVTADPTSDESFVGRFKAVAKSITEACNTIIADEYFAGDLDDEAIYADEAVQTAIKSLRKAGEACTILRNSVIANSPVNEDNLSVVGILADAIQAIVADGAEDEDEDLPLGNAVIDQVEDEYSNDHDDSDTDVPPEDQDNYDGDADL